MDPSQSTNPLSPVAGIPAPQDSVLPQSLEHKLAKEADALALYFLKESQAIAEEVKQVSKKAFEQIVSQKKGIETKDLKNEIALNVNRFIKKRLGREPMIIPLIMYF